MSKYGYLREEHPNTIPLPVAADLLDVGIDALRFQCRKGTFPFAADFTVEGGKQRVKIFTERFIAYMEAEDIKKKNQSDALDALASAWNALGGVMKEGGL